MSIKEMNKEIAQEWIAALESGEYKQGKHQLNGPGGFCCLGVLCDIHAKKTHGVWTESDFAGHEFYLGERNYLPLAVAAWAGIGNVQKGNRGEYLNPRLSDGTPLSLLNDIDKLHFTEIAAVIREDVFGKEGQ